RIEQSSIFSRYLRSRGGPLPACLENQKGDPDLSASPDTPMSGWPTSFLGRLPVAQADIETSAAGFIAEALAARGSGKPPFYSPSANGQVLALCGQDPDVLKLMLEADQIHADGMPMVLYSQKFSKKPLPERVATTDLVHAVAGQAE